MDEKKVSIAEMKYSPNWPMWPYLPVKRRNPGGGNTEVGYLVDRSPLGNDAPPVVEPTVYLRNIWDDTPGEPVKLPYANFEALIDDGWVVD